MRRWPVLAIPHPFLHTFTKHVFRVSNISGAATNLKAKTLRTLLPNTVARPACKTCLQSTWVTVRHSWKGRAGHPCIPLQGYSRDFDSRVCSPRTCGKMNLQDSGAKMLLHAPMQEWHPANHKTRTANTPAPCRTPHMTLHIAPYRNPHHMLHPHPARTTPHTTPLKIVCLACQSEAQLLWKTNTVTKLLCSDETSSGMGHVAL